MNARPLKRRRRIGLQRIVALAKERPLVVDRLAETVEDASQKFRPDLHLQGLLRRNHLAPRAYALHLADRHQENMAVTEAHDLGRNRLDMQEARLHVAKLAHAYVRPCRLDDEPDDLHDLAAHLDRLTGIGGIEELLHVDAQAPVSRQDSVAAIIKDVRLHLVLP